MATKNFKSSKRDMGLRGLHGPRAQSDVYEEVSDSSRNQSNSDNPYDGQVDIVDYID